MSWPTAAGSWSQEICILYQFDYIFTNFPVFTAMAKDFPLTVINTILLFANFSTLKHTLALTDGLGFFMLILIDLNLEFMYSS